MGACSHCSSCVATYNRWLSYQYTFKYRFMCGIVGATAERNVVPILVEGLRRLEYRGYDSAGVAVRHDDGVQRRRAMGKVAELEAAIRARLES